MKTTSNARTRQPKVRTARLVGRILTLTENGRPTSFHVREVRSELGGRGIHLEKFEADCRGEGDADYHVHLHGEASTCECKGFLRWGHCRHIEELMVLEQAGKLEVLDTVVCCHCRGHKRLSAGYGEWCRHCRGTGRQPTL